MTIALFQSPGENKENIMEDSFELEVTNDDNEQEPFYFEVPESLKVIAERDNSFVSRKKRLLTIPASPNVVTILEGYVKNFAVNILCSSAEKTKPGVKPVVIPERSIDLCKEIISDLRIMFDFILPTNLLYANEREQYEAVLESYVPPMKIEETPMPSPVKTESSGTATVNTEEQEVKTTEVEPLPTPPTKRRRSNRAKNPTDQLEESNERQFEHLLPVVPSAAEDIELKKVRVERRSSRVQSSPKDLKSKSTKKTQNNDDTSAEPVATKNESPKDGEVTKRQTRRSSALEIKDTPTRPPTETPTRPPKRRSKSTVSDKETKPEQERNLPASPSKDQEPFPPLSPVNISPPRLRSTHGITSPEDDPFPLNSHAVTDIMRWKIIPNSIYYETPPIASVVYGAPHLLRLFARISEFVSLMPMSNDKRRVLASHLEQLLVYLRDRRDELFPDSAYEGHSDVRTRRH